MDRPVARWIRDALGADPRINELPLTASVATAAVALQAEGLHGDPADGLIVATARDRRATLITRDVALRAFDPAGTHW